MDARTIIAQSAHEWLPMVEPDDSVRLDAFVPSEWERQYTLASLDATGIMGGFTEPAQGLD